LDLERVEPQNFQGPDHRVGWLIHDRSGFQRWSVAGRFGVRRTVISSATSDS
jgi:hypothetical protein